jgi:DNA-binding LytR/AlgR family response regulator
LLNEGGIFVLVGICDDEAAIQEQLIRLCMKYKETNINDLETVCFSSGDELLKFSRPLDILFLDIQMRGLNGLQTAEKIREKDDSMIIIFLTGYRGYMQQGYRVRAFRYLIKPVIEQEL